MKLSAGEIEAIIAGPDAFLFATIPQIKALAGEVKALREALMQARNDIDLISDAGNVNPDFAFEKIDRALNRETHSGTE